MTNFMMEMGYVVMTEFQAKTFIAGQIVSSETEKRNAYGMIAVVSRCPYVRRGLKQAGYKVSDYTRSSGVHQPRAIRVGSFVSKPCSGQFSFTSHG